MTKRVIATLRAVGFHRWDAAPPQVAYLASRHRHEFVFRVEVRVQGPDRETEFHLLQAAARAILGHQWPATEDGIEFGGASCESIAETVLAALGSAGYAVHAVEVWEDAENGARVEL